MQIIQYDELIMDEDKIGEGGFGVVYSGKYMGEKVAIKQLIGHIDKEEAIRKEATYQEMVNGHENCVKLFGYSTFEGNTYLVMEYMAGGSLWHLMHKTSIPYSYAEGIGWLCQGAQALAYLRAHSVRGYIHRDVKPSNMLLDGDRKTLKICDYGLMRNVKTNMTSYVGTAIYMAPEVLNGKKYDEKCDVYSFGITIWEVFMRKMPYEDIIKEIRLTELLKKIDTEDLRPPIDAAIPKDIRQLIRECWDKDCDKRPSMQDIADRLRKQSTVSPSKKCKVL
ncbi:mitogen-activated protein kinase kinase kinase 7 [Drosophila grimshawi]|uniref:GH10917 n=1 Tax=Drosophila grimshawi TaxID=7222 RepID=B4JAX2_DROGR|nr:mitogen-activated protein kinase kinase kinase 7 [Drosophila grimshawi]EDW02842.1 GH10917 [Drosophila grimshawi]